MWRLARWFDDRLRAAGYARQQLRKIFPDHWSFMLGEIALYSFVVLVLTGTYLAFFYVPSSEEIIYRGAYRPLDGVEVSQAYASVLDISFAVRAGLVMRQGHHWAALVFNGAIVTHLARIFFTGAFRKPRELNWMVGLTLLLLGLANGFLGYSLLDDLLSGTGMRIAYSVVLSIPFAGPWLAFLVFGGEFPAAETIPRFFFMHVFLLPILLFVLIGVHLAIIWHQKHTQFPGPGRTEDNVVGPPLWPTYAVKSIALFLLVTAVLMGLGGLLQINPVWLWGPFIAETVSIPAQPDWYVGWLEGALRLFPPWELQIGPVLVPNPFFPGVLLPAVVFALLYAWPFLEARWTGDRGYHHLLDRPSERPVRTGIGVAGFTFFFVIFLAGANDVLAVMIGVPVTGLTRALQAAVVLLPALAGLAAYLWSRQMR